MKNIEVLSPVGDVDSFYMAVKSGCDAVYMGLPKFNARMRAENITLENLPALVEYAHLKDVKVYITLNTLLSNAEIVDAVTLVGKCLESKVDAFIVQDLGLISVLKKCFPGIILHGSTQLGVHNVRGAIVAKKLGLSRVVLSREVTIKDIREIAESVDIQLEVFVQGANCICFSGNCYLSSLKCGASGNRGECKQLCRLPYVLSSSSKELKGYTLSPRDNCMLSALKDLIDAGVVSLKIEGRLRHLGYVGVATNVYRHAVDKLTGKCLDEAEYKSNKSSKFSATRESANTCDILASDASGQTKLVSCDSVNATLEDIDIDRYTKALKKVFSRGEYVCGYNHSNNIIDPKNNNHMGELIGKVTACKPFKDIYKITIATQNHLHTGDGLKFESAGSITSLGVGNVEIVDGKQVVFGKNNVVVGSNVYLALDTEFENSIEDLSLYRDLDVTVVANANAPIEVRVVCGDSVFEYRGDIVESAKTRAITEQNIAMQFGKVDKNIFGNINYHIETKNAFISLSSLNEIRRMAFDYIRTDILSRYNKKNDIIDIADDKLDAVCNSNFIKSLIGKSERCVSFDRLAFVSENANIAKLSTQFDALILDPEVYSEKIVGSFLNDYKKFFDAPLIINLPIIARGDDLKIIESIVEKYKLQDVVFVANNIYGLSFDDVRLWAGYGLNIVNDYSADLCAKFGASEIIASVEKWCNRLPDTYKLGFCPSYMTLTSCPVKLLYGSDCSSCKYDKKVTYSGTVGKFRVRRVKIASCYFELVEDRDCKDGIIDLR